MSVSSTLTHPDGYIGMFSQITQHWRIHISANNCHTWHKEQIDKGQMFGIHKRYSTTILKFPAYIIVIHGILLKFGIQPASCTHHSLSDCHGGSIRSGAVPDRFGAGLDFVLAGSWADTRTNAVPPVNSTCTLELTLEVGTLACRLIVAEPEGIVETLACALDLMMFCEFVASAYIS